MGCYPIIQHDKIMAFEPRYLFPVNSDKLQPIWKCINHKGNEEAWEYEHHMGYLTSWTDHKGEAGAEHRFDVLAVNTTCPKCRTTYSHIARVETETAIKFDDVFSEFAGDSCPAPKCGADDLPPFWFKKAGDTHFNGQTYYRYLEQGKKEKITQTKPPPSPGVLVLTSWWKTMFPTRRRLTNQRLIDRFIRESLRCQTS